MTPTGSAGPCAQGIREEFSDVISPGSKKADAAPAFGGFGSKPSADAPAFGSTNGAAAKEPPAEKAAVAPAFGAPKSGSPAGADASKEKPAFGGAFSFGAKPDTKKDGDGDAAARPSGGGLFSFGGASAGGDAGASKPTGGFSFGGASTGALPAFGSGSGGFQFGAAGGKAEEGAGEGGDGAEEDEEEEKEAKARRVRVDTEPEDDENENVFEAKAKYFMQDLKDKSWNEIGLGLVVVKRPKAGGKPFVIFRKTEGGRVLLTTPVYEGMRLTPGQNNPKMGVCNVYPLEVDHKTQERQVAKEPRTALFKVGKAETIEELNKVLAAK